MNMLRTPGLKMAGLVLVGLAALASAPAAVRADATDDAWAQDAARKEEEAWRKRVYGDPWEDATRHLFDNDANATPAYRQLYAAIAYSPSTGRYGWAKGYRTLAAARQGAVDGLNEPDGRAVIWGPNGRYFALAAGTDGAAGATGRTKAEAKATALEYCGEHTTNCKILFCFFAGD